MEFNEGVRFYIGLINLTAIKYSLFQAYFLIYTIITIISLAQIWAETTGVAENDTSTHDSQEDSEEWNLDEFTDSHLIKNIFGTSNSTDELSPMNLILFNETNSHNSTSNNKTEFSLEDRIFGAIPRFRPKND